MTAAETYWPGGDGSSAARIEEELVVTAGGCAVITRFPAEELLVTGRKYWTAGGRLDTLRDAESHLRTRAGRGETSVSARPQVQSQVERGARVGKSADGHEIDPGRRDLRGLL